MFLFPLWWRKIKFISAVVAENKIYFRRDARNAKKFPPSAFSATTAVNISNRVKITIKPEAFNGIESYNKFIAKIRFPGYGHL
jgi:hypothetical protein